jgi:hypothetical protein
MKENIEQSLSLDADGMDECRRNRSALQIFSTGSNR